MALYNLQKHHDRLSKQSLHRLFEEDDQRASTFSVDACGLFLDYSKNHIDHTTFNALMALCNKNKLTQKIEDLLSGKHVNHTENRPALHSALRFQNKPSSEQEHQCEQALQDMEGIVEKIHTQQWLGFSGKPITTVINIGIGGSDLGPRMVTQALTAYTKSIDVKFVANIDGCDLHDVLQDVNPENSLFIIVSKSFTTLETLENARSARQWMLDNNCNEHQLEQHFIAVSTNLVAADTFGINPNNVLPMWDWVGGRYSLWSSAGLSIAIAIGMQNFRRLLLGANAMDKHFSTAPFDKNMPVILALLTYWYSQYWATTSHAILPYAQRLSRLPSYLQQLDMESLGKSVTTDGNKIDYTTGNIIWGTEGSNGQHSFHQLLHQGTLLIPLDFIIVKEPMSPLNEQHQHLLACCISQSQALLKGKSLADAKNELNQQGLSQIDIDSIAPHKVVSGNKPSNMIIMEKLNPEILGSLLALYEHKVYTLGVLLHINPFDQWGVELGKELSRPIHQAIVNNNNSGEWDNSTRQLIDKLIS